MIFICREKLVLKGILKYVIWKVKHKVCGLELDNMIKVQEFELFEEW